MANIEIQRKQSHAAWWILGLILVALLLFWLFARRDGSGVVGGDVIPDTFGVGAATGPATGTAASTPGGGAAVDQYLAHVRGDGDFSEMGRAHDYTARGLRLLAGALGQVAQADTAGRASIDQRLAALRGRADALQRDPSSARHAEQTAEAFAAAADAMRELQRVRFPDAADQVRRARDAAGAISPARPLLEQQNAVQEFFRRSADALSAMSNRAR